jgi:hypothetical protein
MEYNKIIAVTGLPGLYELLSSKSDGAVVRSLDDKTTRFVSSRIHNFSHLESIEVYTVRDNVNLVEILKAMEVGTAKLPDEKDAAALKNYFTKVYPDLDFSRVYSSDLKKMVKWFSVLKTNNIEIKLTEPEEEEVTDEVAEDVDGLEESEGEAKAKKPAKKKEEAQKAAIVEKPAAVKKAAASPKSEAKAKPQEAKAKPEKKEPAKKTAASPKTETKARAEKKVPAKKAAKKK